MNHYLLEILKTLIWNVLFIIRYEVKYQNGMECGGSYVKLLSATNDLKLVSLLYYNLSTGT